MGPMEWTSRNYYEKSVRFLRIGGLVAEYIIAIDVTRVRFPADATPVPMQTKLMPSSWSLRAAHMHARQRP